MVVVRSVSQPFDGVPSQSPHGQVQDGTHAVPLHVVEPWSF